MITTHSSSTKAGFRNNRLLQGLALFYLAVWLFAAIEPLFPFDWFLENLLIFLFAAILIFSYRRMPLSDLSYILITVFASLHTLGSHYTYAETPFGFWMQDLFGFERNHYDRVVHFSFGLLLSYPLGEIIKRKTSLRSAWTSIFTLTSVMAFSEGYEILEWLTATVVDPAAALAFLGTQGDEFDAQKDSGLAATGAVISIVFVRFTEGIRRRAG